MIDDFGHALPATSRQVNFEWIILPLSFCTCWCYHVDRVSESNAPINSCKDLYSSMITIVYLCTDLFLISIREKHRLRLLTFDSCFLLTLCGTECDIFAPFLFKVHIMKVVSYPICIETKFCMVQSGFKVGSLGLKYDSMFIIFIRLDTLFRLVHSRSHLSFDLNVGFDDVILITLVMYTEKTWVPKLITLVRMSLQYVLKCTTYLPCL